MKLEASAILMAFVWCIFMGITVGSIGLGAAFPSVNLVAKPFVCPNGKMELSTQRYQPTPVETVTTITWYCVDPKTGDRTELGIFPMSLYAGTIYGLLLFVIFMLVSARMRAPLFGSGDDVEQGGFTVSANPFVEKKTRVEKRLLELNRLRDTNLISEEEYQRERSRILTDL